MPTSPPPSTLVIDSFAHLTHSAEVLEHTPVREHVPGAAAVEDDNVPHYFLDVTHETRVFFVDFPVVRPHDF